VAVLTLAVAAGASAMTMPTLHPDSSSKMSADTQHAAGTVSKIDAKENKLVLRTGNVDETFRLEKSTSYTDQGRSVQAADLKPGEQVLVDWSTRDGKNIASNVKVVRTGTLSPARG